MGMSDASPGPQHLMPQFPTLGKGREIPSPLCLQGPIPTQQTPPGVVLRKPEKGLQVVPTSADITHVSCVSDSSGVAGATAGQATPARRHRELGSPLKGPELTQDIRPQ